MAANNPTRYEPQPEDAQRMSRLAEEVRGRLLEMALITARIVGHRPPANPRVRFLPLRADTESSDGGDGDWVEIMEDDGVESCYGVKNGEPFAESPCGAADM